MKIGGPKPPSPSPISPTKDGVTPARSNKAGFAEALHAPKESASAPSADRSQPLDRIIEGLRTGTMDSEGAAQEMIDHIVAKRGEQLSLDMQQQLRDSLESAMSEDPMLAAKLRKLDDAAEADR